MKARGLLEITAALAVLQLLRAGGRRFPSRWPPSRKAARADASVRPYGVWQGLPIGGGAFPPPSHPAPLIPHAGRQIFRFTTPPKCRTIKLYMGRPGCGRYENSGVCRALRPRPPRRTEARDSTVFKIIQRRELNPTVTELVLEAPLIAKKAQAGQFIIIRAKEDSERIPLTIAGL